MNDQQMTQLEHLQDFTAGSNLIHFTATNTAESYAWISEVLSRFGYHRLRKKDKREVFGYVQKMSGYSRQQLTRSLFKQQLSFLPFNSWLALRN